MMPRKPGFTEARHRELGPELAKFNNLLARLECEAHPAYGRSTRVSKFIRQVRQRLDLLTSELDDQIHRETALRGERRHELFDVYYPANRIG
jgi:hypothetical protein